MHFVYCSCHAHRITLRTEKRCWLGPAGGGVAAVKTALKVKLFCSQDQPGLIEPGIAWM